MTERQGMTWLQGLIVKIVMLAVAVGIIFWAVHSDRTAEMTPPVPESSAMVQSPAVEPQDGNESDEPTQPERKLQANAPPPLSTGTTHSSSRPAPPPRRTATGPLDINLVGVEDLAALPALGDVLAQRVVDYRKRHGGFRSVDELRKVKGIGEKRMEQLRPLVVTHEVP